MASNIARPHVPEDELHAYCDGELSPPQRIEIAEHLLGCLICRSQHAEVEELRARTATLLAIAVPRITRQPARPQVTPITARRRLPRITAAAAAAVVGLGVWFSLQPDNSGAATSQLAGAFVNLPFVYRGSAQSNAAATRSHQLDIVARASAPSAVPVLVSPATTSGLEQMIHPVLDIDPVVGNDWPESSLDGALKAGNGSLARITGLSVATVRTHSSGNGARPTFLIRQLLPDGRPVWIFEGQVDDITPVNQVLQASGISMSIAMRSKPDYVGNDSTTTRTMRMVTVVGHLPVDSLNVLMGKLKLR